MNKSTLKMFKLLDSQYARAVLTYPEKDVDPILVVLMSLLLCVDEEPDRRKRADKNIWACDVFEEWINANDPLDVWGAVGGT